MEMLRGRKSVLQLGKEKANHGASKLGKRREKKKDKPKGSAGRSGTQLREDRRPRPWGLFEELKSPAPQPARARLAQHWAVLQRPRASFPFCRVIWEEKKEGGNSGPTPPLTLQVSGPSTAL